MHPDQIARIIIGKAIEVHKELGPGLLESIYAQCLNHELTKTPLHFTKEVELQVVYKGLALDKYYKIDFLVENTLVVELKSVETIIDTHLAQTLTYMKLGKYPHGLLINFNEALLKNGIRRLIRSEYLP